MSVRRLRLLGIWAVLLFLGGSIYLGPYFAAWRIRQAVEARDADALHAWVDFEAVRANLKGELRRTIGAANRRAQERERQPEAAGEGEEHPPEPPDAASQLAVAVGEAMIDRFATPEGVDRALRGSEAVSTGWNAFLNLGEERDEGNGRVSVDAAYDGWNDFRVRLGVRAGEPPDEDLWADILFERRGIWTWRVTGARVSPRALPMLVN